MDQPGVCTHWTHCIPIENNEIWGGPQSGILGMEQGIIRGNHIPSVSQPFGFSLANSGDKSVVASQTVSFSVSGLPSGATGFFSSTSCTPACSTVLNISTSGSTPAGNFPITITQTGGGMTRTTAFTLIVTLASTVAAPTITSGATYWVAKTGSDSNSCSQAQSQSTPRLTINGGLKCLAGGDTLYILSGTYNEKIESRAGTPSVPSGTSWTNMTTISAAPGSELKVILRPDSADHVVYLLGTHRYINFNGLVLDGSDHVLYRNQGRGVVLLVIITAARSAGFHNSSSGLTARSRTHTTRVFWDIMIAYLPI